MKEILSQKKWHFWAAYVLGMIFFSVYCVAKVNCEEAIGANFVLVFLSHFCAIGATGMSSSKMRRNLLWRTFALYILANGMLLFISTRAVGLVGGYALFALTGYIHTRILKDSDKRPERNINEIKYILWGLICLVILFLNYWQI